MPIVHAGVDAGVDVDVDVDVGEDAGRRDSTASIRSAVSPPRSISLSSRASAARPPSTACAIKASIASGATDGLDATIADPEGRSCTRERTHERVANRSLRTWMPAFSRSQVSDVTPSARISCFFTLLLGVLGSSANTRT